MQTTLTKKEIFSIVKDAVHQAIREENENKTKNFLKQFPEVSKEEMNDIESLYGKAPRKKRAARVETIII
ncbi:MAG TPA: hypothetical protein PLM72_10055 [Spirochaetota bacterium]|nr:hypothetical protein [Spirochaetota bacterium]HQO23412.1 hypothetical protein [Spirochaetota bacterium]